MKERGPPPGGAPDEAVPRKRVQLAAARIAEGRRMIDEGLALLAGDVVHRDGPARVPRRTTRPAGESDEVAAAKARRILREKGFVPR